MDTQQGQIERILKLTEETHQMVKSMKRRHAASTILRVVYVGVFFYISWWAYQEMRPYIEQVKALSSQVSELSTSASNTASSTLSEFGKLLDKIPK